jgi:transposase InsO family protein
VVDSGASHHMTGSKEFLSDVHPHPRNVCITYGDGSSSKVLGLGKVVVTPDVSIVDIMLVKTLSYNLLSVSQLADMGFGTYFDVGIVVLMWSKSLSVAFVGYAENGLYVVDFSKKPTPTATCLMAKADVGWLWHRRLAHVNMRTLQSLHKNDHILGLKDKDVAFVKDRVCRACIEGKLHETQHKPTNVLHTSRVLELLHMDLFGPPTHESLGGKKYCLVIVDDYSRYTWVFFLKKKSETQQIFIDFANEVQRQNDLKILAIRSDNGTEFKNYTMEEFLGEEGIRHQFSAPYTPQQNGVAERKNRTLMDMARTMIAEYKSPYNFWAEAISTACHTTNRVYLHKYHNKTSYEIYIGKKPSIQYFRVFGCKCYILKKGNRLSKFETRAYEGIFVGYGKDSHTYRIYNKATGTVIETCNVKFDEHNGSQVGQFDLGDVGDEMPPQAIRRMGVGFHRPVEYPLVVEGEGQCSTQVEPSPTQDPLTPSQV